MAEQALLSGWGRATWSRARVARPAGRSEVQRLLADIGPRGAIARGLGRSYGDQAVDAGGLVIETSRLGGTDSGTLVPDDGIVTVSAGTSIGDLIEAVVPSGWFPPVVPGTRHVTIGGAVANDIHGKNHHVDGSFGTHVVEIELLLADGAIVRCSPDVEPNLFWATVAGMGLTGIALNVSLRLIPVESSRVEVDTMRLGGIDELMAAMIEADRDSRYSVAWIDLVTRGRSTGRSVLTTGDFASGERIDDNPLTYAAPRTVEVPDLVPGGLLTRPTVRAFNEMWFRASPSLRIAQLQGINRFFHPLDAVGSWNRLYGSRGLIQWQMVVPDGAEDALRETVDSICGSSAPAFLGVLKRFGEPSPAPMSFPLRGWTLAADFPARGQGVSTLLDRLDRLVADAGGRVYLAKDARMDPGLLDRMYPRLSEWMAVRDEVDPSGRWQSDLSRRLGLT
jgi:decaprenylphospho-beta-D-ribofuranose 2-oxidase